MCHHEHGSRRAATAVIQNIIFLSNYWVGNKFILELDESEFDYLFAEEWHHPTSAHKFKRFDPYLGVEPVMVRLAGELLTTPASHPLIAGFILS